MSRLSRFLPRFLRGRAKEKNKQNFSPADKSFCKIIFLDETEFSLPYKGSLRGLVILERVYEQLNLLERDYFGLRFIDHQGQTHWLETNKNLSSQLKGCSIPYTLYFGVKFYPADPCKLREEITRYQFFLQVKCDILHARLPITFEEAAELFAYAVQSEIGDYDPQRLAPGYVSEFQFVPTQTEELEEQIEAFHKRLGGTIPATAELKFLDKVKWLDMYGVDLHPVLGESNTEYFLGLTPTGIVVYKNKTKVGNYFWPRITKVNSKAKVFIIKVKDKINDEHTYAFELAARAACKHLWKCCMEHHEFFRLNQLGDQSTRASKRFRSTAKHRSSGRQSRQNNADQTMREQPRVLRVQSRRQARRTMSDTRLHAGDMTDRDIRYNADGHITMVVNPEQVKGPRHRSLPDLKGRTSPTSTRSAPWETNTDVGLYTSGRESPVSVTQSENVRYRRANRDSDSESGFRRNGRRGYDSDGDYHRKHHHSYHRSTSRQSRLSGYDTDPHSSSGHRRKYFPSSRKGSDNESDASVSRRRRREGDSGSESDISPQHIARQRQTMSVGPDRFEREWQHAMQGMYIADKENRPNGSIPSLHSAPGGEARQKKMRRRRSKSPSNKRPPEELRQHIEFDLVDPENMGLTDDQMRDIPYTSVETKAEPFRVRYSPKTQRHRYRSPKRKPPGEMDGKGYMSEDIPPPYTQTPDRTPDVPHRPTPPYTQSPDRTPDVPHRPTPKTAGYVSDTNSIASRNRQNASSHAAYAQQYNNISSPQPPKPIDVSVKDDHGSAINMGNNTRHACLNMSINNVQWKICLPQYSTLSLKSTARDIQHIHLNLDESKSSTPDFSADLQGQVQIFDEDDRNVDSGLNSSQGSSMTNTTPRNRMYGTQDAIARLYSSPSGPRRVNNTPNQSNIPSYQNMPYNQYNGTANQNVPYNHVSNTQFNSRSPTVPHYEPQSSSNVHNQSTMNSYNSEYNPQSQSYNPAAAQSLDQSGAYKPVQPSNTPRSDYNYNQSPYKLLYNKSGQQTGTEANSVPQTSQYYNSPAAMQGNQSFVNSQQNRVHAQSTTATPDNFDSRQPGQPTWQYVGNDRNRAPPSQGYTPSSCTQNSIKKSADSGSVHTRSPHQSPSKHSEPPHMGAPQQRTPVKHSEPPNMGAPYSGSPQRTPVKHARPQDTGASNPRSPPRTPVKGSLSSATGSTYAAQHQSPGKHSEQNARPAYINPPHQSPVKISTPLDTSSPYTRSPHHTPIKSNDRPVGHSSPLARLPNSSAVKPGIERDRYVGNRSPYPDMSNCSPVKTNGGVARESPMQHHRKFSALQDRSNFIPVQDRSNFTPVQDRSKHSANQSFNSSMMSSSSANFRSPDSAISSLASMSNNNNNYKSMSGSQLSKSAYKPPTMNLDPSSSGVANDGATRTRTPAFGNSNTWTEL